MINLIVFVLLLLGIAACVVEFYFVGAYVRSGFGHYPPFFPSFGKMKKVCLAEARKILAEAKSPLKVYDLGCGSGSLLLPLAKEFPQHQFVGCDWDVFPYAIASFRARHISNIELLCADYTKMDLQDADLVLIFGGKKLFAEWGKQFASSLKKGAVVISEAFPIPQLEAEQELETPSYGIPLKIYAYIIDKKTLAK